MKLATHIRRFFNRRQRIRKVTNVASRYSRELFPQDRPVWSMVAEEREDECVVYMTYERRGDLRNFLRHRFFRVRLQDLSVTDLQSEYYPAQWGPYC